MENRNIKGEFTTGGFVLVVIMLAAVGLVFFLYGYPRMNLYFTTDENPIDNQVPDPSEAGLEGADTGELPAP